MSVGVRFSNPGQAVTCPLAQLALYARQTSSIDRTASMIYVRTDGGCYGRIW